ncbi:MAG: DUF853 family protein [Oscillospiraceae bacterium]|nr:DUF853 family protein [Oscillospiraceae bacterium]
MFTDNSVYLGLSGEERVKLELRMANRHGLITGASGTGKTVTMKVLAESFSDAGVPVFLCDVKGDVSGLCVPGEKTEGMEKQIDRFGIRDSFEYKAYPVCFWDVYGAAGHPVRATVSDMGPDILSSLLGLTEAQRGVLNIIFKIADDHGLKLIDLKDLRAMLNYVGEKRADFILKYGNITAQSLGGVLRSLLPLETQGGSLFFGEPSIDILDWIRTDADGRGFVNILDCVKLINSPTLYAAFMLFMMSELFERLPEVGDPEKPKLVFFFDEAHLLFSQMPKSLVSAIEHMVRLIRSKGVGVYFVTQSPGDLPDSVLGQLSNRVHHALRAYTPAEQKALRAAAASMRPNPEFDTAKVMLELGVGEALVSVLDSDGVPTVVKRTAIICPQSLMAEADSRSRKISDIDSGMEKYDQPVDNESAYEILLEREEEEKLRREREALEKEEEELQKKIKAQAAKEEAAMQKAAERRKQKIENQLISVGGSILRRGILKTLFGKK